MKARTYQHRLIIYTETILSSKFKFDILYVIPLLSDSAKSLDWFLRLLLFIHMRKGSTATRSLFLVLLDISFRSDKTITSP